MTNFSPPRWYLNIILKPCGQAFSLKCLKWLNDEQWTHCCGDWIKTENDAVTSGWLSAALSLHLKILKAPDFRSAGLFFPWAPHTPTPHSHAHDVHMKPDLPHCDEVRDSRTSPRVRRCQGTCSSPASPSSPSILPCTRSSSLRWPSPSFGETTVAGSPRILCLQEEAQVAVFTKEFTLAGSSVSNQSYRQCSASNVNTACGEN